MEDVFRGADSVLLFAAEKEKKILLNSLIIWENNTIERRKILLDFNPFVFLRKLRNHACQAITILFTLPSLRIDNQTKNYSCRGYFKVYLHEYYVEEESLKGRKIVVFL